MRKQLVRAHLLDCSGHLCAGRVAALVISAQPLYSVWPFSKLRKCNLLDGEL